MPAARPSQKSLSNVLGALMAAGLTPGTVHVNADGTFRVEVAAATASHQDAGSPPEVENDEPPTWENT